MLPNLHILKVLTKLSDVNPYHLILQYLHFLDRIMAGLQVIINVSLEMYTCYYIMMLLWYYMMMMIIIIVAVLVILCILASTTYYLWINRHKTITLRWYSLSACNMFVCHDKILFLKTIVVVMPWICLWNTKYFKLRK